MVRLFGAVCLCLLAGAAATKVTPIEKVIELIEGMAKDVRNEGKDEADAYERFACFCQKTTQQKSSSVKKGEENINLLSADIADKTQERKDDLAELKKRKQEQEAFERKLEETTVRCAKQKAEYEAEAADMNQAIQGLKDAIKAMTESKPSALLQIPENLKKTFEMAEAMNMLKAPKHKAVAAFIQNSVDPTDPEYQFHSEDIIDACKDLLSDYKDSKQDLDDEWGKTLKGCNEMKSSLNKSIQANDAAMKQLDKDINRLASEIAKHREDLVEAQSLMKDDELYLKDLTARCEDRANDYDQRSAMRADELKALTTALDILKKRTRGADEDVNKRAFIQQPNVAAAPSAKAATPAASKVLKSISLLQEASVSSNEGRSFLGLTLEARKNKALDVLRSEGKRIGSVALTSLAERTSADPFEKIKGLIQKLIERLLQESANEATKKGFCDTELGKARKERDFRWQESKDLNAELEGLEAKRDALEAEIKDLTSDLEQERKALKETTEQRKQDKEDNMATVKTAKEGLDATKEALLILKSFYKQAAKAAFVQASPVDEDTKGPGFSGNYKGNQSGSKAVLDLLDVIISDFDRTIRKTEEEEHAQHRAFVEFSQASESNIAGKETKKELDEQDLKTTNAGIETNMDNLQSAANLLDNALQELEELKPTCIDTGMSYAERVAKREEEMKALNEALRILS